MSDGKPEEPQDLRKELNQLWRTTLDQFDEIKNAIVRSSTAGKAKLDATFLKRQRDKLLAELGARVLESSDKGELVLPERLRATAARVREIEAEIEEQEGEVDRLLRNEGAAAADDDETPPPGPADPAPADDDPEATAKGDDDDGDDNPKGG